MSFSPIDISSGYGWDPELNNAAQSGMQLPLLIGGVYYMVLQNGATFQTLEVFSSVDRNTWAAVAGSLINIGDGVDVATAVVTSNGISLTVAYNQSGADTNIVVRSFTPGSGWAAGVTTNTGNTNIISGIFYRSNDGSYVILSFANNLPDFGVYRFSAGVLSAFQSITANNTNTLTHNPYAGIDQNNVIRVLFGTVNGPNSHIFYQQYTTANTLGNFHDTNVGGVNLQLGNVVIDNANGNIVLGVVNTGTLDFEIYWGHGLSVPVWHGPTVIDAAANVFDTLQLTFVGSTLVADAVNFTGRNVVNEWVTANLTAPDTGWSAKTPVFDGSQTTIVGWNQNALRDARRTTLGQLFFISSTVGGTFCIPCHQKVTAELHARRAKTKRQAKANERWAQWHKGGTAPEVRTKTAPRSSSAPALHQDSLFSSQGGQ